MDEAQIADQLKQKVAVEAFVPAAPDLPTPSDGTTIPPVDLDELTQFKIHDFFGEQYHASNEDNKERIQFIFDTIASQIGDRDYLKVMSRASEIEQMIGTSHSENRIYRLYQWLGLDQIRRKTETAMRLVNG